MKVSFRARAASFAVLALLVGFGGACTTGQRKSAPKPVSIYDSNVSPLPGNIASQGFQCCQVSEFGDEVALGGTARKLTSATVTMSNWAKHSTPANLAFPTSNPGTGFDQPLRLNIYAAGPGNTLGALLGTRVQVFHIPWRPEADPVNCPTQITPAYGYKYQSTPGAPDTNCFNGLAVPVTFDLKGLNITAPTNIVWGVAFNTQTYGSAPIGSDGPYNSLNVGTQGTGAAVGTDVDTDIQWVKSAGYGYCDGGAGGLNTFRANVGCGGSLVGFTPSISFSAL